VNTFIQFVESMNVVYKILSCVPWIHIFSPYESIQLINYQFVDSLSLFLIHDPREQLRTLQHGSGLVWRGRWNSFLFEWVELMFTIVAKVSMKEYV